MDGRRRVLEEAAGEEWRAGGQVQGGDGDFGVCAASKLTTSGMKQKFYCYVKSVRGGMQKEQLPNSDTDSLTTSHG